MPASTEIVIAAAADRATAMAMVLRRLDAQQREDQAQSLLALENGQLLEARRDGRLVAATFWYIQPGKTAMLWAPVWENDEPESTAVRLLQRANDELAATDVSMAYCLLESFTTADHRVLSRGGLDRIAELLYLVSLAETFPEEEPRTSLTFCPYSEASRAQFAQTVQATYEGTQDCPRLNGVRAIEDVLEGYRHMGQYAPERWLLVRHADSDIGCLIVTDHAEHGNCELVYMGVVPSARGQGWGREITRYAQWLARCLQRPRLVLAADAANRPAIEAYGSVGFHPWQRRTVYAKVFRRSK